MFEINYSPHKSFISDSENPTEWAVNLFLLPSTRKSWQSFCNWKRMGRPTVLLFPVRGKLQSRQCPVIIGPLNVSWNLPRCCLIGSSLYCDDLTANPHLSGWVPLPLPTSCCSQSAYSADCVCVGGGQVSPHPPPTHLLFPLQNSQPTVLSTPIPLSSHTHTHTCE